MNSAKVAELNDRAVKRLVDAHSRLEEPLLLAIRYKLDEPGIHLFEVLDGFPGEDTDEPLETEFGSSPEVRMIGTLKLALVNPRQFRVLAKGSSAIIEALKNDGRVEFYVGEGKELAELLGLKNGATRRELDARQKLIEEAGTKLTDAELEDFKKAWT